MEESDHSPTGLKDSAIRSSLWVSRTSPDNERTAKALRMAGYKAVAVPVLRVEGLSPKALADQPDAIVFTSMNGVRHHFLSQESLDIPVFAVGDRTAQSAVEAGFTQVFSAAGNVSDLERLIVESLPPGSRLLHLSARRPAGDLTGKLHRRGYLAMRIAVYETREIALAQLLASLPALNRIGGILIHSPRAGHAVRRCIDQFPKSFEGAVYCISEAAAAPFVEMQRINVRIAERPDEASMLALIATP
ncbi:uroporphyrinogen-III synthase [Citromicrobium bathyomarinum]